jgi:hypothetical protein
MLFDVTTVLFSDTLIDDIGVVVLIGVVEASELILIILFIFFLSYLEFLFLYLLLLK